MHIRTCVFGCYAVCFIPSFCHDASTLPKGLEGEILHACSLLDASTHVSLTLELADVSIFTARA